MGANEVVQVALAQVGKPYVWAKAGPNSYDCSGLVKYAYKHGAGIDLPHFTGALWTKGRQVKRDELGVGDLVFPLISHVQIYIGQGKVVEAPRAGMTVQVVPLGQVQMARRIIAPGSIDAAREVAIPNVPGPIDDVARDVKRLIEVFSNVAKLTTWLMSPGTWVRMAMFGGGAMLVLIALIGWTRVSNVGKVAAKAAKGKVSAK